MILIKHIIWIINYKLWINSNIAFGTPFENWNLWEYVKINLDYINI